MVLPYKSSFPRAKCSFCRLVSKNQTLKCLLTRYTVHGRGAKHSLHSISPENHISKMHTICSHPSDVQANCQYRTTEITVSMGISRMCYLRLSYSIRHTSQNARSAVLSANALTSLAESFFVKIPQKAAQNRVPHVACTNG